MQAGRVKASEATVLQTCNFDNEYYSSGIFNDLHYLGRKQIGVKKSLSLFLAGQDSSIGDPVTQ